MDLTKQIQEAALRYHEYPKPGKLMVVPTKELTNQRDLALAYSPGVASASVAIHEDPLSVARLTARGNLVGVVTNGSAVLGLGNIGPLAAKPVMEGKSVLFKKFAGIDAFDIEIDESNPDRLIDIIAALEPTFGAINLEDIKAPECFYIEKVLRDRMNIPVFHDDQHGTAIVVAAFILNGLHLVNKKIEDVKIVTSGAGAAALACLELLVTLGAKRDNIWLTDIDGVIYRGRTVGMDAIKDQYAKDTKARVLDDVIIEADIFLGLSAGGILKKEMVKKMATSPLVMALANPHPEILPEDVHEVRDDAIIATGRSDYPNQVNNVLCFPFIFRGALDVGATGITNEMKIAAVRALAQLARSETPEEVARAYSGRIGELRFGKEYLIPRPFDPRLIVKIAPAVAQAAIDSGVATRPFGSADNYQETIQELVYHSSLIMKPVFSAAKQHPAKVLFCEGEDERVLQAISVGLQEKIIDPVVIGRPHFIEETIKDLGLGIRMGRDFEVIDVSNDSRLPELSQKYHELRGRFGVTPVIAEKHLMTNSTLLGCMLLECGDVQGVLCGTRGAYAKHLAPVRDLIGLEEGNHVFAALNLLMLPNKTLFICDTYINHNPDARTIADIAIMAAREVERFGLQPKIALLSHSNFGSDVLSDSSKKMRQARQLIVERAPQLEVDGEMHGDAALVESIRHQIYPGSTLKGTANLLVMPNLDAANIAYNLLKSTGSQGITVGPVLVGPKKVVHILTPTATVRRILNMTALTVVDAHFR